MRRGSYPPLLINDMKQAKAAAEEDDMMAGDWNSLVFVISISGKAPRIVLQYINNTPV